MNLLKLDIFIYKNELIILKIEIYNFLSMSINYVNN